MNMETYDFGATLFYEFELGYLPVEAPRDITKEKQ